MKYVFLLLLITAIPTAYGIYQWKKGYEMPFSFFFLCSYGLLGVSIMILYKTYVSHPLFMILWHSTEITREAGVYEKPALPNLFFLFSVARSGVKGGLLSPLRYSSADEQRGFEEEVEGDAKHKLGERPPK